MKNVLIIGYSSFIGNAVADVLRKQGDCKVSQFDIIGIDPEMIDFAGYDAVIMAAGIEPTRKADRFPQAYYAINRDLTYHTAMVAKACGVKQFVILSSLDVYGTNYPKVMKDSPISPETDYAKSKYEADQKAEALENSDFRICIVRLPVVYGNRKSGVLQKIGEMLPRRSHRRTERIHIDKVCAVISQIIDEEMNGIVIVTE